jgi:hypothetical protein
VGRSAIAAGIVAAERKPARLAELLAARRGEIEQAALTRIFAIADPTEAPDPAYPEGLRAAVSAGLDYGLEGIERGEERSPPIPVALLGQARTAARNGVALETVLRRYFAGYTLLSDLLVSVAESSAALRPQELKRLLRALAARFDRLLAAVSEEYRREAESRLPNASQQRRAELVERLLAGELLGTSELSYDFDSWHLGCLAAGEGAGEAIRDLAASLDCRLLLVHRSEHTVWAWLGSRRKLDPAEVESFAAAKLPEDAAMALGEPGGGLAAWRLTHRQALAALPVALRSSDSIVRYGDIALFASVLQDDLLVTSLKQLYLAPLEHEHDGGEVARQALRAYFAADRNVSAAAAALGVNRNTVASRLRAIESMFGRQLGACAAELEAALRMEELGS